MACMVLPTAAFTCSASAASLCAAREQGVQHGAWRGVCVLLDEQYGLHGAAEGGIHEMVQSTKVATEGIISDGSKCNESSISHASKEKYQKKTNKAKLERTR
jgi:hypothetical protein